MGSQAKPSSSIRDRVFVSYSHADAQWLNKLRGALAADIREDRIDYWDDRDIRPGEPWYARIVDAIDCARVAVLLVSPNFLASRFIMEEEVPRILKAVEEGLTVLWVPLSGTFYGPDAMQGVKTLNSLQAVFDTAHPLDQLPSDSQIVKIRNLCRQINKVLHPHRIANKLPFPPLGNLFKGREAELARLDEQLRRQGSAGVLQPRVINGLAGIGKTRLALEYAWRHAHEFTALLFVSANTPADLAANVAKLSARDGLDLLPDDEAGSQDEHYAAVIRWLQQNKGWLLIIDNVDTREGVAAVQKLVAQISGGQILITSQYTRWGEGIVRVPLEAIPLRDAIGLLLEKTHSQREVREEDEREASVLAEQLGCLPLALTHAAAYVSEYELGFADYLSEFDQAVQFFDPEFIRYQDPEQAGILKTVATTFFISFDRLGVLDKAVLRAASFLAPEPVPVAMFEQGPAEVEALVALWCEEKGEQPAQRSVRDALAELARFSLITRGAGVFSVHRMEQLVLRSSVPKDRVPKWIEATRAVLVHYAPEESAEKPKTWPVWDKLRPHAEAIVAAAHADERVEPQVILTRYLGYFYYGKGLYEESLAMDEASLKICERIDGGAPSADSAHQFLCYGETLRVIRRFAEAEAAFRKSLAMREQLDGPDSLTVASDLNYVALAAREQGRDQEAEALYRRALAIYAAHEDADPADVLKVLNNLGHLLLARGEIEEPETLLNRAWKIAQEIDPSREDPTSFRVLMNVGQLAARKGDMARAETLYREGVEGFERILGENLPDTLSAMEILIGLLTETSRKSEADALRVKYLERFAQRDVTSLPVKLREAALVYYQSGDYERAEKLYRRILQAGVDIPETHVHLARVFLMADRETEARAEVETAEQHFTEGKPYLAQRIRFLQVLFGLLDGRVPATPLQSMKEELARPDVVVEWDLKAVLEHVKPRVSADAYELLEAIAAAINDRSAMERLKALPMWPK